MTEGKKKTSKIATVLRHTGLTVRVELLKGGWQPESSKGLIKSPFLETDFIC